MKEDFCYTYYDGDAARDKAHMNRLERGAYDDIISAQRKRGHLSMKDIQKVLSGDFESCWGAVEWVLKKDSDGKYFIEWVDKSLEKMRRQSEKQKVNADKRWKKDAKNMPPHSQNNNLGMPLVNGDGDVNGKGIVFGDENDPPEKNENPLGYEMSQTFAKINPDYPPKPSKDMPAIVEIAVFIHQQLGGLETEIIDMDVGEQKLVLAEWKKWCEWYAENGRNKSLETLVKFKLQEIFSEIKNKKNGHKAAGKNKPVTSKARKTDSDYAGGF